MRVLIAASLAILLAPIAQGLVFEPPAQARGDMTASGDYWLVVSLNGMDSGDVLQASNGVVEVHEYLQADLSPQPAPNLVQATHPTPTGSSQQFEQLHGGRAHGDEPLLLVAQVPAASIHVVGHADMWAKRDGEFGLPSDRAPVWMTTAEALLPGDVAVLAIQGAMNTTFQAQSSQWFNLACDACPAPRQSVGQPGAGGEVRRTVLVRAESIISLSGVGEAWVLGNDLDLDVDGDVRLPKGQGDSTLSVKGQTSLDNLSRTPSGLLRADVDGNWTALYIDEVRGGGIDSASVAGYAAGAGALILAVALIGREILAKPLKDDRRRLLYRTVQENPGIHVAELKRRLGWGNGSVVYAIYVLQTAGLIRSDRHAGHKLLYAKDSVVSESDPRFLLGLNRQHVLALIRSIEDDAPKTRAKLVRHATRRGVPRSTCYRLVDRLQEGGYIDSGPTVRLLRDPRPILNEMDVR